MVYGQDRLKVKSVKKNNTLNLQVKSIVLAIVQPNQQEEHILLKQATETLSKSKDHW